MTDTRRFRLWPVAVLVVALIHRSAADGSNSGLSQTYCSSQNTGSNFNAVFNIYQSNGACYDQCQSSYAFAIVQYQQCWCSNYIPGDQQSIGLCNQNCPGYPDDKCGNATTGLYGYIQLPNVKASGTTGASSSQPSSTSATSVIQSSLSSTITSSTPTSSTSSPSTSTSSTQQTTTTQQPTTTSQDPATSYVSVTIYQTVVQSQQASIMVSHVTPTPPSSSTTPSSSSSSSISLSPTLSSTLTPAVAQVAATPTTSSSWMSPSLTPSPVTSVQVVTVAGAIVTHTVTSTPLVAPAPSSESMTFQRKGLSGGAVAGIVIASLIGAIALVVGAVLVRRRRRQGDNDDAEGAGAAQKRSGPNSPRRNVSVLSKTGLLSRGRAPSITEKEFDPPIYGTGHNSMRHSTFFASAAASEAQAVSPVSPLGSTHEDAGGRRHSRPLVYDQRLNPSALFLHADGSGSRISVQDAQDYSRPLGVTNPDVRRSFDSRTSR
ncbi:hypothetical protein BAUCODRAFT_31100 [Baudoinia panamericana UAMH 10762]|uniref:WSC domain-containing protein n=1 Tax=Baudoinia panamericana (strain UAMH 10762) TaxID=717646 RepID=M2N4C2_BAUPA|nr:uncharacterized protein BAUCODRAFT_31100 [Baudoinia panamericana UAMH 10762]EMC98838.1 hypothetical protein BAUCODRAFT_31100 [Baudoinia panamericana UAMH 10762]